MGSCSCCRWWAVGWVVVAVVGGGQWVVVAVVGGGQYVVGSCRWWAVCSG